MAYAFTSGRFRDVVSLYLFSVILAVTIGSSRTTYVFTMMYTTYVFTMMYRLTNAFRVSITAVIAITTVLFSPRVPTGAIPRAASALKTQSYFESQYPKTNYATMCPPQVSYCTSTLSQPVNFAFAECNNPTTAR